MEKIENKFNKVFAVSNITLDQMIILLSKAHEQKQVYRSFPNSFYDAIDKEWFVNEVDKQKNNE